MVITNPDRAPGSAIDALAKTGYNASEPVGGTQPAKPGAPTRPGELQGQTHRWYDLDRYAKYRDPLLVVGFAVFLYGCHQIPIIGEFVVWLVCGAGVMYAAIKLS